MRIIYVLAFTLALLTVAQEGNAQTARIPDAAQSVAARPAPVPGGNPFYEAGKDRGQELTPQELGDIVECDMDPARGGNIKRDKIINVKVCGRKGDRAFASPMDYLDMLPVTDPDSGVTSVDELPAYFRSLIATEAPQGNYISAWLKPSRQSPTGWKPEARGVTNAFKKGEKAWRNPRTNKIVFKQGCTNPVIGPEIPPVNCAYQFVRVHRGDTGIRYKEYAPMEIVDDVCSPMIMMPGSSDWENPWYEECVIIGCDFAGADRVLGALGFRGQRQGSRQLGEYDGYVILRLPRYAIAPGAKIAINWCIESAQGISCGKAIEPTDYRRDIAVVGYVSTDKPDPRDVQRITGITLPAIGWDGPLRLWNFILSMCNF